MMTEEQAKLQWCPHSRVGVGEGASANRSWQQHPAEVKADACFCLASRCMAWRWHEKPGGYVDYDDEKGRAAFKPTGYCGLAGKP